jgi:Rne/Rng family ribonuclease
MSKQILIDSYFGLVRTAIAEGQVLMDYYEESPEQGRSKGNIYRGVVKKVDAPIQAAFVRFGAGRDGFLPLRDAGSGNRVPKPGDTVLVQVVKDEVGDKGAALTTKLSLSGRYLVFIPDRDGEGGISSRITDEERAALKKILGELQIPEGGSVILRTAAMNKGITELQADLDRLTETCREITDKFSQGKEPGLLFREVPPALRYLREYYTPDVERIWVNQEDVLNQCRQFFYLYEPKSAAKVALSQDGPLMFQKLGLEADVEKLNSRKVALPSGANIVIDQAEALVAIDVNSAKAGGRGERGERGEDGRGRGERGRQDGKARSVTARGESEAMAPGAAGETAGAEGAVDEGKGAAEGEGKGRGKKGKRGKGRKGGFGSDLEETVFAVNLEAASEIARQLRLRDLGGIIIVDFIDMEDETHRRRIEEAMRKALAADKAKVKVYDISPLGIMQISRQRLRKAGTNFARQGCEACQGRGWHPSSAAAALGALRKMEERLHGKKAGQSLSLSAPYPVANKLMNEFREHVMSMERRFGCTLRVTALPAHSGDIAILSQGPSQEEAGSREHAAQSQRGRKEGRPAEGKQREGRREEGKRREDGRQREDGRRREEGRQREDGRRREESREREGRAEERMHDVHEVESGFRSETEIPFETAPEAGVPMMAPAEAEASMMPDADAVAEPAYTVKQASAMEQVAGTGGSEKAVSGRGRHGRGGRGDRNRKQEPGTTRKQAEPVSGGKPQRGKPEQPARAGQAKPAPARQQPPVRPQGTQAQGEPKAEPHRRRRRSRRGKGGGSKEAAPARVPGAGEG